MEYGNLPPKAKVQAGKRKLTTGGTSTKKTVTPSQAPQGGGAPGTKGKK